MAVDRRTVWRRMFQSRFDNLPPSPFRRLAALIDRIAPGSDPIDMSIGEPRHAMPDFVKQILADHTAEFSRYPPAIGIAGLREAIAAWISRRYSLGDLIDPSAHIIPVCGSREALFNIAPVIIRKDGSSAPPAVLMPNPFYQVYATAAVSAGAEPVLLPATAETGHLPDLDALSPDLLDRTAAFYLCTPANPQGTVASLDYLKRVIALAREHDFVLLSDECYSELYAGDAPPSAIEAAAAMHDEGDAKDDTMFSRVVIFNSLSKRSNLAGLRSGFCAGDPEIVSSFLKFRNIGAPQMPMPIQAVSQAVWSDEAHVEASRDLYRRKYAMVADMFAAHPASPSPQAGMFLWLDVGSTTNLEDAALRLWRDAGVKVIPGNYLALDMADGSNPGAGFLRAALVHDLATTRDALARIAATV